MAITVTENTDVILSKTTGINIVQSCLLSYLGGVKLVGQISPFNGNNAITTLAAVDSRKSTFLILIAQVGVIDEAVDVEILVSATEGGSYESYHAFSQIPDTSDNKQLLALLDCRQIPTETPWVKVTITVGNGTSSLVAMSLLSIGTGQEATPPTGLTSVLETYSEIGTPPFHAAFTVGSAPSTPVSNISSLTLADCTGEEGVAVTDWSPIYNTSAAGVGAHANLQYVATTTPVEETLTGVVLFDPATGNVIFCSPLKDNAPIAEVGDAVFCELLLGVGLVM